MLIMTKRITITVDESIYEMLEASSEESMRPIAVEAVYRIKLGLGGEVSVSDNKPFHSVNSTEVSKERVVVKPKKEWGGSMFKDDSVNKLVKSGKLQKGSKTTWNKIKKDKKL